MKGSITKKLIAIVLTFTMVATMNASVFATDTVALETAAVSEANAASDQAYTDAELEASGECGNGTYYYLYADGTFVLKAGDGASVPATVSLAPWEESQEIQKSIKHLIIEDSIEAIIPTYAFNYGYFPGDGFLGCCNLETVTFPQSFKSIPNGMFCGCYNLKTVIMPVDLEYGIGSKAFSGCRSLENFIMPESFTELGQQAFEYCEALKQIELCEGLITIPSGAFMGCTSLENISIPDSVTTIGLSAFAGCTKLKDVRLPKNLNSIESYVFKNCTSLKILYIPPSVENISEDSYVGAENRKLIVEECSEAYYYAIQNDIAYSFVHMFFNGYQEHLNPNETSTLPLVCWDPCQDVVSVPVKWTSSDTSVAEVEDGVVTGVCPGTAKITASYKNDSVSCEIQVGTDISAIDFSTESTAYLYTGNEICPDFIAKAGNYTLTRGNDYTLQYENNIEPGVANVIVKGTGKFSGEKTVNFRIIPVIDEGDVTTDTSKALCTGEPITKIVAVKDGTKTLVEGKDYTVSYENNVLPGTAKVIIEGLGDYGGRVTKEFVITCDHAAKYVRTERREATCTAAGYTEEVYCPTCKTVQVKSQAIPATGHSYNETLETATPEKDGAFKTICLNCNDTIIEKITKISDVELSSNEVEYTGETYTPAVTVKDAAGKVISTNDYLVTYGNGFKLPGAYTVKVDFINNYSGSVTKNFIVTKGKQVIKAANVRITVGKAAKMLNAKRTEGNGKLSYTSSNKKVATVSSTGKVTPKAVGKTTITITAKGTEKYKKTIKKVTVSVVPKGTKLSGLKTTKNGSVTASWKKASGISGYQLRYSAYSNMRNAVTVGVSGAAKTSVKKAGLSKGQKYYVQIRTYKTVNGQKLYSEWSSKKSITTMNAYLNVAKFEIKKGNSKNLIVKNRNGKTVKWSSSNKNVAKVSDSGKVTAKGVGTATITAKVGEQYLYCKVKVHNYNTGKKPSFYGKLTGRPGSYGITITNTGNKTLYINTWGFFYPAGDNGGSITAGFAYKKDIALTWDDIEVDPGETYTHYIYEYDDYFYANENAEFMVYVTYKDEPYSVCFTKKRAVLSSSK